MKVATVSCREETFTIERDQLLNVNDIAGSWCFGSRIHIPLKSDVDALKDYDCVWFTMSKQVRPYEKRWMELLYEFKSRWPQKKVILHQEAEVEFYLMRPSTSWDVQRGWIETLYDKVDLLLAHNARDAAVYRSFMGTGRAITWRTVQDIEKIIPYRKKPESKEKVVGVGTYDGRSNGLLGVSVASKVTKNISQITRSVYNDDRNEFVNKRFGVRPQATKLTGWYEWLENISNLYLFLNPMMAKAAGRDTINCAAIGVPIIGCKGLDPQEHLFPELTVDPYDVRKMEYLLLELLQDERFYERVRKLAMNKSHWYDIESGVERAEKIMEGLGYR